MQTKCLSGSVIKLGHMSTLWSQAEAEKDNFRNSEQLSLLCSRLYGKTSQDLGSESHPCLVQKTLWASISKSEISHR